MRHLYLLAQTPANYLRLKIEALTNGHHSKLKCLSVLSQPFTGVGNHAERKPLSWASRGSEEAALGLHTHYDNYLTPFGSWTSARK